MKESTSRNSEVLADFVKYCEENPEQRFWQALRNWTDYDAVLVARSGCEPVSTFYWEGKNAR